VTTGRVVRKVLDDDCLLDGELHPAIAARLQRVRELPMTGVASLIGVEREGGRACLVWEHVEGRTLEELVNDGREVSAFEREVRLLVETMHSLGVVHGNLHAGNVIIDGRGSVKLTHVAPLLYDDPQIDRKALDEIFGEDRTLKGAAWPSADVAGDRIRVRSVVAAAGALVAGIGIVLLVLWYASSIA
jgi:hypothetical protein